VQRSLRTPGLAGRKPGKPAPRHGSTPRPILPQAVQEQQGEPKNAEKRRENTGGETLGGDRNKAEAGRKFVRNLISEVEVKEKKKRGGTSPPLPCWHGGGTKIFHCGGRIALLRSCAAEPRKRQNGCETLQAAAPASPDSTLARYGGRVECLGITMLCIRRQQNIGGVCRPAQEE
jgi:hypothetical protein